MTKNIKIKIRQHYVGFRLIVKQKFLYFIDSGILSFTDRNLYHFFGKNFSAVVNI